MISTPVIRKLDNGDVVVDFGRRWFRCSLNGQVTAKIAENGSVSTRPATARERLEVLGYVTTNPVTSAIATGRPPTTEEVADVLKPDDDLTLTRG